MLLRVQLAVVAVLATSVVQAQTVQLPKQLPQNVAPPSSGYSSSNYQAPFAPNTSAPPAGYLPNSTAPSIGAPSLNSPVPPATFNGTIQPFDPYAAPINSGAFPSGAVSPGAAPYSGAGGYTAPPGFTGAPAGAGGPEYLFPNGTPQIFPQGMSNPIQPWGSWTRLLQAVSFYSEYIYDGNGTNDLSEVGSEISATLAVPAFNLQTPFLITPGFAIHLWSGPESTGGPDSADLPGSTYDAYLDVGWNPQVNNWFGAELGARIGAYTAFDTFTTDSIRIMGRGLGVVRISPTLTAKLGAVYIDRNDIKLLPAGGLVWDPSSIWHCEFIFPRPKIARRFNTMANHNVWGYVSGEYGGGSWTIIRAADYTDSFDYNDIRVMLGMEWIPETESGRMGFVEVGYVFNRELIYVSLNPPSLELDSTFMVRAGVVF